MQHKLKLTYMENVSRGEELSQKNVHIKSSDLLACFCAKMVRKVFHSIIAICLAVFASEDLIWDFA